MPKITIINILLWAISLFWIQGLKKFLPYLSNILIPSARQFTFLGWLWFWLSGILFGSQTFFQDLIHLLLGTYLFFVSQDSVGVILTRLQAAKPRSSRSFSNMDRSVQTSYKAHSSSYWMSSRSSFPRATVARMWSWSLAPTLCWG